MKAGCGNGWKMQGNAEAARRLARFDEDGGAIFADGLRLAGSTPRYLGIPPQMLPRVAAVFPALQAEKNAPLCVRRFLKVHKTGFICAYPASPSVI